MTMRPDDPDRPKEPDTTEARGDETHPRKPQGTAGQQDIPTPIGSSLWHALVGRFVGRRRKR